jgi:sigma-B regulation protein RsbU (phosphoserine phosphatase)
MAEPFRVRNRRTEDPSIGRVFIDDVKATSLRRDYGKELKQLYYFYLDDERREKLAGMGRIPRAISLIGWLLKSLFLKLSPTRRLMLVAAFILSIAGETHLQRLTVDFRPAGFLLLLIVLMLELKDKLLAKDEIAIARQVQLALLPRNHPEIPGWRVWSYSRPANDVGGDLVDYVELDGFRHGIVLGDVAGKGLGAALLTAKLQATLRAVLPDIASLDDLGRRVNNIFYSAAFDNRYATLFFAQLEHHSNQIRYLNAGHNPPFVIRRAAEIERLHASSYPLGMLASAEYEEGCVEMLTGEIMLAYSDGLTELMNERGEEYGVERLEQLIPDLRDLTPEAIGARILQDAEDFMGEARPGDDLSLAIIVRE